MTRHNPLTVDEYRSLIKIAKAQSPRNLFTVILVGHTGMRAGTAAEYTPEWLDEENQTITIPNEHTRSPANSPHSIRRIPVSSEVVRCLTELAEQMPERAFSVSPSAISQRIKRVVTAAGIENCSAHELRRFYARQLQKCGVSQEMVAEALGFRVPSVTGPPREDVVGNLLEDHLPLYDVEIGTDEER